MCQVFTARFTQANIPDLYAKHQLLDYQHGQYPFVVTTLEKTDKKLYSSRSYPQLIESLQQVLKVETDAAIDSQSLQLCHRSNILLGAPQVGSGQV
jgi:hypothetical protein